MSGEELDLLSGTADFIGSLQISLNAACSNDVQYILQNSHSLPTLAFSDC